MSHINSFRQTRKNLGLSLQDTAYLLNMNVSNLSKVEYEKITPSMRTTIAYHLISGVQFDHLYKNHISTVRITLVDRLTALIDKVRAQANTPKHTNQYEILSRVLKNLTNIELNNGTEE